MKRLLLIHTGGTLGMKGRRPHALKPGAFLSTLKTPPVAGTSSAAATAHALEPADSKTANTPLKLAFIAALVGVGLTIWRSLSRKA